MFKETKLNTPKVKVKDNAKPYGKRKCPPGFDGYLHRIQVAFGSIGRGKTTALVEFVMMMQTTHTFDKVFWISPTFLDEEKRFNIDPDILEIIPEYTDKWLLDTQAWIKNEIKEYHIYEEYYKVYQKCIIQGNEPTMQELMLLTMHDFDPPRTKYIYGYPCFKMIFDDMVGEKKIFSTNMKGVFPKFLVSVRHYSVSLTISVQIFKSGIPSTLRGGNVYSWLLYGTNSAAQRKMIAEELADKVENIKAFDDLWFYATNNNKYDFLYVDYGTDDPTKRFRKNWHTQLELPTKVIEEKPIDIRKKIT